MGGDEWMGSLYRVGRAGGVEMGGRGGAGGGGVWQALTKVVSAGLRPRHTARGSAVRGSAQGLWRLASRLSAQKNVT